MIYLEFLVFFLTRLLRAHVIVMICLKQGKQWKRVHLLYECCIGSQWKMIFHGYLCLLNLLLGFHRFTVSDKLHLKYYGVIYRVIDCQEHKLFYLVSAILVKRDWIIRIPSRNIAACILQTLATWITYISSSTFVLKNVLDTEVSSLPLRH